MREARRRGTAESPTHNVTAFRRSTPSHSPPNLCRPQRKNEQPRETLARNNRAAERQSGFFAGQSSPCRRTVRGGFSCGNCCTCRVGSGISKSSSESRQHHCAPLAAQQNPPKNFARAAPRHGERRARKPVLARRSEEHTSE